MTFDAWKSHWGPEHENLPRAGAVEWRNHPRPTSRCIAARRTILP